MNQANITHNVTPYNLNAIGAQSSTTNSSPNRLIKMQCHSGNAGGVPASSMSVNHMVKREVEGITPISGNIPHSAFDLGTTNSMVPPRPNQVQIINLCDLNGSNVHPNHLSFGNMFRNNAPPTLSAASLPPATASTYTNICPPMPYSGNISSLDLNKPISDAGIAELVSIICRGSAHGTGSEPNSPPSSNSRMSRSSSGSSGIRGCCNTTTSPCTTTCTLSPISSVVSQTSSGVRSSSGDSPVELSQINSIKLMQTKASDDASAEGIQGQRQRVRPQCTVCGKRFKHKANLKIHSIVHTPEAICCPICGKRFARKSNFAQHLRIHTGEKPYKCSYCQRTFAQSHR